MLALDANGFGARTFQDGTWAGPGRGLPRNKMLLGRRSQYQVQPPHHIGMIHQLVSPLFRYVGCVGNHDDFRPGVDANPQCFRILHHILGMGIEGVRVVLDEALHLGQGADGVLGCSLHSPLVGLLPLQ